MFADIQRFVSLLLCSCRCLCHFIENKLNTQVNTKLTLNECWFWLNLIIIKYVGHDGTRWSWLNDEVKWRLTQLSLSTKLIGFTNNRTSKGCWNLLYTIYNCSILKGEAHCNYINECNELKQWQSFKNNIN